MTQLIDLFFLKKTFEQLIYIDLEITPSNYQTCRDPPKKGEFHEFCEIHVSICFPHKGSWFESVLFAIS